MTPRQFVSSSATRSPYPDQFGEGASPDGELPWKAAARGCGSAGNPSNGGGSLGIPGFVQSVDGRLQIPGFLPSTDVEVDDGGSQIAEQGHGRLDEARGHAGRHLQPLNERGELVG